MLSIYPTDGSDMHAPTKKKLVGQKADDSIFSSPIDGLTIATGKSLASLNNKFSVKAFVNVYVLTCLPRMLGTN